MRPLEVLEFIGLRPERETDEWYQIKCPFHKDGNERKPSMGVHKEVGTFNCFTCGQKGTIEKLVAKKLNIPLAEAYSVVINKFNGSTNNPQFLDQMINSIPEFNSAKPKKITNDKLGESELILYKGEHTYLLNRGISRDTQIEFEIGFDKYWKRVTIPVRDTDGTLLSVVGRGVFEDIQPKYYFYNNLKKSRVLFNLHRIIPPHRDSSFAPFTAVILVEGVVDVMWLHQIGIKNVVASFGCSLSQTQADLIAKYFKEVYVCYDNDDAGIDGRVRVRELLDKRMMVKDLILPPEFKDAVGILKPQFEKVYNDANIM